MIDRILYRINYELRFWAIATAMLGLAHFLYTIAAHFGGFERIYGG